MRFAVGSLALLLGLIGHPLLAQDSEAGPPLTACVAHLPPNAYFPVAVYAYVHIDSGLPEIDRSAAEDFLPDVIDAASRVLGGSRGVLPHGDSTLTWQELNGSLRVTAYSDGRMTWVPESHPDQPSGATRLLARAVSAARSSGAWIGLPQDAHGKPVDSLTFDIRTTHPEVDQTGKARPMRFEGTAAPIFSAPVPWTEGGGPVPGQGHPFVPNDASDGIVENGLYITVVTRFVIDTLGHVVPASIHDVWSNRKPPTGGENRRYWDGVAVAIHQWLLRSSFEPFEIGGCREPKAGRYSLMAGYPPKK